jgi:5-(carboxyamino)imidazole ribonucleotide synthase
VSSAAPILGVLGGGQLGRMLALAAARLGVRTRCLDRSADAVAGHVAELVVADMDAPGAALDAAVERFCDGLSAATYEFENVPVALAKRVAERVPTYPDPAALGRAQDRLVEKTMFRELGIPTPAFARVDSAEDAEAFAGGQGLPVVLKTRRMGYDGKGQRVVRERSALGAAVRELGGSGLIAEAFVPFDRECSVLVARGRGGGVRVYPLCENEHAGVCYA